MSSPSTESTVGLLSGVLSAPGNPESQLQMVFDLIVAWVGTLPDAKAVAENAVFIQATGLRLALKGKKTNAELLVELALLESDLTALWSFDAG